MRISVRILISSLLAAVTIFGCSILAFASEETPEQVPEGFLVVDQDQASLLNLASDVKAASVTEYSTTDIYNLLYSALRGSNSSTTYSLPYIANRLNNILGNVVTINTSVSSISSLLSTISYGLCGTDSGSPAYNVLDSLYHYNDLDGNTYGVAQLLAMSWGHLDDISDNLSNYLPIFQTAFSGIDHSVDAVNSTLSTGFAQVHSDFTSFDWVNQGSFLGVSYDIPSTGYVDLSSRGAYSSKPYFLFNLSSYSSSAYNSHVIYHFRLPIALASSSPQLYNFDFTLGFVSPEIGFIPFSNIDYIVLNNRHSTDLYVIMPQYFEPSYPLCIRLDNFDSRLFHYEDMTPSISYLLGDSKNYFDFYDRIKFASLSTQIDKLTNALVPDNVAAAEAASQAVIDDTLDGFTGSGSAAAKVNDTSSMKNVSGSLRSGLETGAGVSNATSVFTLGSDFWLWFSQDTSDMINSPYPAPVVQQLRGSGDEIVDFLSGNDAEVQNLLRGSEW